MANFTLGQLIWKITGDASGLDSSVRQSQNRLQGFAQRATRIGSTLTKSVTLPIVGLGAALVKLASDAEETGAKFDTVFAPSIERATEAAENLAENYGLSSVKSQQLLSDTGDLLTGFGFTSDAALDLAERSNQLAVDLASFTNFSGGAEGASQALTKAMLGESEQAKALGIVIRQDSEEYQNLVKFYQETQGASLLQAKALTALEIATKQSKNAIGDFARTQDGFANQLRIVKGEAQDLAVEFGKELLPIAKDLLDRVRGLVERFSALDDTQKQNILKAAGFAAALGPVLLAVGKLTTSLRTAAIAAKALATGPLAAPLALVAGVVLVGRALDKNYTEKLKDAEFRTEAIVFDLKGIEEGLRSGFTSASEFSQIVNRVAEGYGETRERILEIAAAQEGILGDEARKLQLIDRQNARIREEQAARNDLTNVTNEELENRIRILDRQVELLGVSEKTLELERESVYLQGELTRRREAYNEAFAEGATQGQKDFQAVNNALKTELAAIDELAAANEQLNVEYDKQAAKQGAVQAAIDELVQLGYKVQGLNIQTIIDLYGELFEAQEKVEQLTLDQVIAQNALNRALEETDEKFGAYDALKEINEDLAEQKRLAAEAAQAILEQLELQKEAYAQQQAAQQRTADAQTAIWLSQRSEIERNIFDILLQRDAYIEAGVERVTAEAWAQGEIDRLRDEAAERERQRQRDLLFDQIDATINFVTQVGGLFDALLERKLQGYELEKETQKEAVQTQLEKDLEALDVLIEARKSAGQDYEDLIKKRTFLIDSAAAKEEKIEKELAREQAITARKQAVFEKTLALANIAVNTAVQASKVLANPILLALVIGAGIAAAATVIATPLPPLPELAEGGIVLPDAGGKIVRVAEAGTPEAVIPLNERGKDFISDALGGGGVNVTQPVIIQADLNGAVVEIYQGFLQATKDGIAVLDARELTNVEVITG